MSARKVYDVSLTIYPGMFSFPGNPEFTVEPVKSIDKGGPVTSLYYIWVAIPGLM
jgi:kynurenine formamidase